MKALMFSIVFPLLVTFQTAQAQWEKLEVPVYTTLHEVNFWDDGTGVVIGPWNVVRTEDGGQSWTVIETPDLNFCGSFSFPDPDTGYALDGWEFFKTTDGGYSWTGRFVATGSRAEIYNSISMRDAWNGNIVGFWWSPGGLSGGIAMETNDGIEWKDYSLPTTLMNLWMVIRYQDEERGYALTSDNGLIYTYDGGETWNTCDLYFGNKFQDVYLLDDTVIVAAASSLDAGKTTRTVLAKEEGADEWSLLYEDTLMGDTRSYRRVWFEDRMNGWITGTDGLLTRTYDGGITWTDENTGTGQDLLGCFFRDIENGIAVGGGGTILKLGDLSALGISTPVQSMEISVFPNPCSDKVTIAWNGPAGDHCKVQLFTLTGETVPILPLMIGQGLDTRHLDTRHLPSGIYLLAVSSGNTALSLKLVVSH